MTYLETFRRRAGFSKSELAFLLGAMDSKTIRRHERGLRIPKLITVLGYGLILDATVEHLYEGLVLEVHESVRARARGLCRRLSKLPVSKKNKRKMSILTRLGAARIDAIVDLTSE